MTSLIVYEGKSELDGAPVVAVLTGGSKNVKTGGMAQLWILRADVEPHLAVKTGQDASICGSCIHRGVEGKGRTCYVQVHQAPLSVYRAYKRGSYPQATTEAVAAMLDGQTLRLGAYGDPLALPLDVLEGLVALAAGHTGYTHQWTGTADWPEQERLRAARLVMASVETLDQASDSRVLGFRWFRTRDLTEERAATEIDCPSAQGVQCADCGLCSGSTREGARSVSIPLHGGTAVMANAKRRGLITVTQV